MLVGFFRCVSLHRSIFLFLISFFFDVTFNCSAEHCLFRQQVVNFRQIDLTFGRLLLVGAEAADVNNHSFLELLSIVGIKVELPSSTEERSIIFGSFIHIADLFLILRERDLDL